MQPPDNATVCNCMRIMAATTAMHYYVALYQNRTKAVEMIRKLFTSCLPISVPHLRTFATNWRLDFHSPVRLFAFLSRHLLYLRLLTIVLERFPRKICTGILSLLYEHFLHFVGIATRSYCRVYNWKIWKQLEHVYKSYETLVRSTNSSFKSAISSKTDLYLWVYFRMIVLTIKLLVTTAILDCSKRVFRFIRKT